MSHHLRGVLEGVVHYCDRGFAVMKTPQGKTRVELLWPWCILGRDKDMAPAEKASSKKALVTCLQCMYIRRRR